jgi:hypothetical protein
VGANRLIARQPRWRAWFLHTGRSRWASERGPATGACPCPDDGLVTAPGPVESATDGSPPRTPRCAYTWRRMAFPMALPGNAWRRMAFPIAFPGNSYR